MPEILAKNHGFILKVIELLHKDQTVILTIDNRA